MEKVSNESLQIHNTMRKILNALQIDDITSENGYSIMMMIARKEQEGLVQSAIISGNAGDLGKAIHANIINICKDDTAFALKLLASLFEATNEDLQIKDLHEQLREELL